MTTRRSSPAAVLAERFDADLVPRANGVDLLVDRIARRGSRRPGDGERPGPPSRSRAPPRRSSSSPEVSPLRFAVLPATPAWLSSRACARCSSPTCISAHVSSTTCCGEPVPLAALLAALEDVDRLVLLGDIVELMEGRAQQAMGVAEPVLRAIARVIGAHGEIIVVPGNHDRPLVRAWARRAGETLCAGQPRCRSTQAPALARLTAWLAPASVRVSYPGVWLDERIWVTHGHYLDWHLMPVSSFGFARGGSRP